MRPRTERTAVWIRLRRLWKRRRAFAEESGSGLVEFAMSALLLFTMIFGIMDCARALYVDLFLVNSAREAVRYASTRGSSWSYNCASATSYSCSASSANVSSFVQSNVSLGIVTSSITTTTTWPGTDATGASCTSAGSSNAIGCVVKVTVTYPFTFASPLLPRTSFRLTSTSEGTIAQ